MTIPPVHSLDGVNSCYYPVSFAHAHLFESRYVAEDDIILPYVRIGQLFDNIVKNDFVSL